jgi:hypothetical protein
LNGGNRRPALSITPESAIGSDTVATRHVGRWWRRASALLAGLCACAGPAPAAPADKVFTVANYPVEARAADAVAAKARAVARGQQSALRSLMKRLVPVAAYGQLKRLSSADASRLVDGIAVRSERNSSTDYIASLDFQFRPDSIRQWLDREGIPYVDAQAAAVTLVPVWRAPPAGATVPAGLGPVDGPKAWTDAWKSLDLGNSLTPVKLEALKADVLPETVKALAAGDSGMLRTFASSYGGNERLIVAVAEPDLAAKRLAVTLIGTDAVGAITWKRAYRLDLADAGYAVELAGVVSLGVLEGRWKATQRGGRDVFTPAPAARPAPGAVMNPGLSAMVPAASAPGTAGNVQVSVAFNGMSEWQEISRRLAATPGVQSIDVLGLSARGARVTVTYPGGVERFADALARQGMTLRNEGQRWVLTP